MERTNHAWTWLFTGILLTLCSLIILPGCKKTVETANSEIATRKKPKNPPPPTGPFYFTNCSFAVFSENFIAGTSTQAAITLNYANSPGGAYPAYTSTTVNGITLSAQAGNLSVGSGSILFTASGTPIASGNFTIPVSIAGSNTCNLPVTVLNPAPQPGNCVDPGPTPGSIGCVTFYYRGQLVSYATVRAADGRVWLQQNLGSHQVATQTYDPGSYGHYFQWGRWDDGHQLIGSPTVQANSQLNNPSHIPNGNPNFIIRAAGNYNFWFINGTSTDTWSGTIATATNGIDPCKAIGSSWRLPTASEWSNILQTENIIDAHSAFSSNLKLPQAGYKSYEDGVVFTNFANGHYWSSTAGSTLWRKSLYFDDVFNAFMGQTISDMGFPCRCVKD